MTYGQFAGFGGYGAPTGVMGGFSGIVVPGGVGIRPWAMVTGSYIDSRQDALDSNGNLFEAKSRARYGAASFGVGGTRSWERTTVSLSYAGGARLFEDQKNLGLGRWSHSVALGVSHQVSERFTVFSTAVSGWSNGGYGFGGGLAGAGFGMPFGIGTTFGVGATTTDFGNPNDNGIVDNEPFNVRTSFLGASAGFGYRASMKWTVSVGGGGFLVRRDSNTLVGTEGATAWAVAGYSPDQRSQIQLYYSFSDFIYRNMFGGNQVHRAMIGYGRQLSEKTMFRVYAGAGFFHSTFLGVVHLDPALAALLGYSGASYIVRDVNSMGATGGAILSHTFRYTQAALNYTRGVTPGDGLLLASRRDSISALASIPTRTRLSMGAVVNFTRASGLLQSAITKNWTGSVSAGYRLGAGFSLTASGGYRLYQFPNQFDQRSRVFSVGLAWYPSDFPFAF
jgi:hypothetical protein